MKYTSYLILLLMLTSCISIYNKKHLMNVEDIGLANNELKLNGYYYLEKSYNSLPYYKNEYGGYSKDSTKAYNQVKVVPIILFPDGTIEKQGLISGMQDNLVFNYKSKCSLEDDNTLEGALNHFECLLLNKPEGTYNFINNKAKIWSQGVYKVKGDEIVIQTFYNVQGNYHLGEERGRIVNDTTFLLTSGKDYQNGKTFEIDEVYHFKEMNNIPKIESYILTHKSKFDKN